MSTRSAEYVRHSWMASFPIRHYFIYDGVHCEPPGYGRSVGTGGYLSSGSKFAGRGERASDKLLNFSSGGPSQLTWPMQLNRMCADAPLDRLHCAACAGFCRNLRSLRACARRGSGEGPLVHAHLPEAEHGHWDDVPHVEPIHDSHHSSRSIDIFITAQPHEIAVHAVMLVSYVRIAPAPERRGFVSIATPRAHAPPALLSLIPRSPPAGLPAAV